MSVCIYIYLYREKSYTTGLAFIKGSSGAWEGRGSGTRAKPAGFAGQSVATRPLPWPFSFLRCSKQEMPVPGACSWPRGSWGCGRSSQEWPVLSSTLFQGLKGWNSGWGEKCFYPESSRALICVSALPYKPLTNTQPHPFGYIYIYIHTYTRTHSFQWRVTRAFLCVCKLTTPVCRHGEKKKKKRVFVLYEYGSFFFLILWACKVKKKSF